MIARPLRRGAAAAAAATLLLAAPASAHPFFEPDEAPVDSLVGVTLDLAHGCDAEDHDADAPAGGGDEAPTREVAIQVPEEAAYVEPAETTGWDLDVEVGDAGEVIVYTAEEGTDEPAPQFELEMVLRGEVDDEVYWRVVQACDDTTERWVGTPDEPAEDPAIMIVLTDADDGAPPPPEAGQDDTVTVIEEEAEPEAPEEDGATEATDDEAEEDAEAVDEEDFEAADDDAGMPGWILIAVLLVTLVIAGIVLSIRSRDDEETTEDDAGADPT